MIIRQLTLPYESIKTFYEGDDEDKFDPLTGINLNTPMLQLLSDVLSIKNYCVENDCILQDDLDGLSEAYLNTVNSLSNIAFSGKWEDILETPDTIVYTDKDQTILGDRSFNGTCTFNGTTSFVGNIKGNTTFDDSVIATGGFVGNLEGNASTATKATQNSNGYDLSNDIIKGLSINGKTITYTKLNGAKGTIVTQDNDTKYTNGYGLNLSGTTFSLAASGTNTGTFGPNGNVTGNNGTSIAIPQITVDAYGRITSINSRIYTTNNKYVNEAGHSNLLATYADDGHYLCPDRYDGWNTRLYMTYGDKGVRANNVHVYYSDVSGSTNWVHWNNVAGKPGAYNPTGHSHNDLYYTKAEIDSKLRGYSGGGGGSSGSHS